MGVRGAVFANGDALRDNRQPRFRPVLGDLRIDYLLGYTTFNFGHGHAVPYVTFGMGRLRLWADACRGAANPCVNGLRHPFHGERSVGPEVFIAPLRLRFDGRYYGTFLGDSNSDGCDHDHHCHNHTDWLSNGDVTGGLIFAF